MGIGSVMGKGIGAGLTTGLVTGLAVSGLGLVALAAAYPPHRPLSAPVLAPSSAAPVSAPAPVLAPASLADPASGADLAPPAMPGGQMPPLPLPTPPRLGLPLQAGAPNVGPTVGPDAAPDAAPDLAQNAAPRAETRPEPAAPPNTAPPNTAPPNAVPDLRRALAAHAAPAPQTGQALGLLLIEPPDGPPLDPALLADLPFRLSLALDPTRPDALARAQALRRAGAEIVILADPAGAPLRSTGDMAALWARLQPLIPEAVALLPAESLQMREALNPALIDQLAQEGLGLLTRDRGLNLAYRQARDAGLAALVLHRQIDARGEDAAAIGRALDLSAAQLRQRGGLVVLGQARPATLAALLDWAAARAGRGVVLAPVSAVLLAQPVAAQP